MTVDTRRSEVYKRKMIRIGVLSDTHLPDTGDATRFLADLAGQYFRDVQLILHAGDIVAPDVLSVFAPCPVYAVRGNMDPASPGLPHRRVIDVEGAKIGLIHGWGPPEGLQERVCREFRDVVLDCIVFGHSHEPLCRREGAMLLFNPGSASDRRGMPYESVGILEVMDGIVAGRIIPLDEF